ncbi:MAG: hypothetical protein JWN81_1316 [Solirubrobacterales bacterium]|nr:hypothetical protein [Solirubrobacterales bacterium]
MCQDIVDSHLIHDDTRVLTGRPSGMSRCQEPLFTNAW